jgi:CheY-like chemotaxis protein
MPEPERHRLLVVDDEPLIREYARAILEDAGWAVAEAANADEALQLLARGDVALVLSDIEMPGNDGIWLLQSVRRNWPQVKLIIMSGRVLPKRGNLPEGAQVLSKPFSADRLLYLVDNA